MASTQQQQGSKQYDGLLSQKQQTLLDRALNAQSQLTYPEPGAAGVKRSDSDPSQQPPTMSGNALYMSPNQSGDLDNFDYTPDLDYLDGDTSFDFENADLGGDMIGGLPGGYEDDGTGQHEKRKSPDEAGSPGEEGDAKRQETLDGDKAGSKRPGRKPLTSEPTTKRKAQNRAAQRAFRERKEKHLKDLETKVDELTKAKEADKHENGVLKATVDRLQVELREYRKRLSLNGNSASRSPPLSASRNQYRSNSGGSGNFQFDFPKFGALPGSQILGKPQNGSATPPSANQSPGTNGYSAAQSQQASRQNSQARSNSPQTANSVSSGSNGSAQNSSQSYSKSNNMRGFSNTLPQMKSANGSGDPFGDLFSPSIMKTNAHEGNLDSNYFASPQAMNGNNDSGTDTTSGLSRAFQFNSGSNASDSNSPSASSLSQWNGAANSSCGTSPEPSHNSPGADKEKSMEPNLYSKISPQLNQNQQYPNVTTSNNNNNSDSFNSNNTAALQSNNSNFLTMNSNTDFNVPQLDAFDPLLFGDYRETADFMGGDAFGGDFFNDALQPSTFDYSSPSNLFGILQSPQPVQQQLPKTAQNAPTPSRNLMAEIEKTRDGGDDDYGLPPRQQTQAQANETAKKAGEPVKLISCNNIWNQLQSNPDFQEGKFDLDGLCSELRQKARCSESGVMVDQSHVDQALRRLGGSPKAKGGVPGEAYDVGASPNLMFEQESWERVLGKMNGQAQK